MIHIEAHTVLVLMSVKKYRYDRVCGVKFEEFYVPKQDPIFYNTFPLKATPKPTF